MGFWDTIIYVFRRDLTLQFANPTGFFKTPLLALLLIFMSKVIWGGAGVEPANPGAGDFEAFWLIFLLTSFWGIEGIFRPEKAHHDLEKLMAEGVNLLALIFAKMRLYFLIQVLPLILLLPVYVAWWQIDIEFYDLMHLALRLVLAGAILTVLAVLIASLLLGQSHLEIVGLLLVGPLMMPILIFASGASSGASFFSMEIQMLIGMALISVVICTFFTRAALKAHME